MKQDGNDVFASSKRLGRYKEIKRTEGVSKKKGGRMHVV
jgi:hypothetical protein